MDYEMKYKGALERAKMSYHTGDYDKDTLEMLEIIFPELKESEDERIRKELIRLFNDTAWNDSSFQFYDLDKQKVIDWLEKQGEINEASYRTGIKRVLDSPESYGLKRQGKQDMIPLDKVIKFLDDQLVNDKDEVTGESFINFKNYGAFKETFISFFKKKMLEKQGEPKETLCDKCRKEHPSHSCQDITALGRCYIEGINMSNKVEPKFKIEKDKWYVCIRNLDDNYGTRAFYKGDIYHSTKDETLMPVNSNVPYEIKYCAEDYFRLWTIQDAKAGDVLYLQKDGKEHIIIYKGVIKERFRTFVSAYCAYNGIVDAFCFADVSRYVDIAYGGIMPATKEQRDTLMKAMADAGYTFDFEKKELKKIEQKSVELNENEQTLVQQVTQRMLMEGPIPTLKGKQKAAFENAFNKFKQIAGLVNWPARTEIYKNIILWFMAWGKEHLPTLNDINENTDNIDKEKPVEWTEEDWKLLDEVREHIVSIIGDKPDFTPNKIYEGFLELIDKLKFAKQQPKQGWGQMKECKSCQFNYNGQCKGYCPSKRKEEIVIDEGKAEMDYNFTKMMLSEEIKDSPKFMVGDVLVRDGYANHKVLRIYDNKTYVCDTDDGESHIDVKDQDKWKLKSRL